MNGDGDLEYAAAVRMGANTLRLGIAATGEWR